MMISSAFDAAALIKRLGVEPGTNNRDVAR
jgi:hypothetical protein